MTAVTEDQDAPAVALQPLTSGGNTPVCQEGRDGDAEVGEEGPLTTIIQDGRPGAHMNGDVLQLGQRPKKRKYLETVVLYTGFLILVWITNTVHKCCTVKPVCNDHLYNKIYYL